MSERVVVTLTTGSASPNSAGPRSARYFIAGQTQFGPADGPLVVRSLSEYTTYFGARTGGAAMYDAAELFLDRAGAGELVVMRATGPSAVKSTVTLDSKIVVTSRNPGSYYDAWTAAYTDSTTTLTIVKGSTTVTYSGSTAALLEAAASIDPDVTVTVSALPSTDVGAANLASGADDYANVVWATTLGLIPDTYGPGAISTPGVTYDVSGSALAAHAKNNRRLALVTSDDNLTAAAAITAATTASAYTGAENTLFVWPYVKVPNGSTGTKVVDPVSYAAAARAIAQRQFGIGTSPLQREVGAKINGVSPVVAINSTDFATLEAAHIAMIRTLSTNVNMDGWETLGSPGNVNLYGAQFRDIINALAADGADILERFVGRPATSTVLAQAFSELTAACENYVAYFSAEEGVHRGYKVTVSNGANPADNRITANIAVRFAEYADFVDFNVAAYDAGSTI